jgi:hypothetical protein
MPSAEKFMGEYSQQLPHRFAASTGSLERLSVIAFSQSLLLTYLWNISVKKGYKIPLPENLLRVGGKKLSAGSFLPTV